MCAYPHPQLNPNECYELNFLNFYYDIFKKEVPRENSFSLLEQKLELLKQFYSKDKISKRSSNINFGCPYMRSSYIFQFAPCFSSIVAHYFSKILNSIPWLSEKFLLSDEICICCIGGGCGTEFIAIAKVLENMLWRYCPRANRPIKLKVTVIDIDSGWIETLKNIAQSFKHLVDTCLITYELYFVKTDVTQPLSEEVQTILSSSDVVTMSKFMTAVQGRSENTEVLQAIFQLIQQEAILMTFLDSSGFGHYDALRDIANSFSDIHQIYGTWEYEMYEMSHIFLQECYRFYSSFYCPYKSCCLRSRNFVSAWHRRKIPNLEKELSVKTTENRNCVEKKKTLQRSESF